MVQFIPIVPEIYLTVTALFLLIAGVFRGNSYTPFLMKISIGVLIMTAVLLTQLWGVRLVAFNDLFITDGLAIYVKILLLFSAAAVLVLSLGYAHDKEKAQFEFPILILLSVAGMMVMASANDLIVLYMGLELQSLCLYVLASTHRENIKSCEAGLKYFMLGALASGVMLYGVSLIYGFAGTTNYGTLASLFSSTSGTVPLGILIGLVLVIVGVCFKISAVPFHMWTPDVYEGSPTHVTVFFAAVAKIAGFVLFIRFITQPFGPLIEQWQQIIIFIAMASMLVGALGAIMQKNFKRLLAYSSIGHAGYILVGLASGTLEGTQAALIYMVLYALMSIGIFACVLGLQFDSHNKIIENISDLSGLAKSHPVFALVIAIFMFSMTGIPPLAGFFGKWFVFKAALESGLYVLAVFGVATSVIAAFYYIKVVKIMYFDKAKDSFLLDLPDPIRWVAAVSVAFNILFFLYPAPLFEMAKYAALAIF